MTKEASGTNQTGPQSKVIMTDEHGAELFQLASQAISRPCVIYCRGSPGAEGDLAAGSLSAVRPLTGVSIG